MHITGYALHYGKSRKVLARVLPDQKYPTMWRVHWPDGEISDMVNLTRARDAARVLARRRYLGIDLSHAELWRWEARRTRAEGPPSGFDAAPLSD